MINEHLAAVLALLALIAALGILLKLSGFSSNGLSLRWIQPVWTGQGYVYIPIFDAE